MNASSKRNDAKTPAKGKPKKNTNQKKARTKVVMDADSDNQGTQICKTTPSPKKRQKHKTNNGREQSEMQNNRVFSVAPDFY